MARTNKFINLKRLDWKNAVIVLRYLAKSLTRVKPSKREQSIYVFYNDLIGANGYLVSENDQFYSVDLRNTFNKKIKLRKSPSSDVAVFEQVYCGNEYLPVVNTYKKNFPQLQGYHLNIIDAGANIGLTSLFFLEHFDASNLISVEPDTENFKMMDFNLPSSHGKVTKILGAVWPTNTFIKIVKDFRDQLDWSFRVEETNEKEGIKAYSINQLMLDNGMDGIDILKIDVEGSEKQLFTSVNANFDFLKKTKCIAIEIHDEFDCRSDIYAVLSQHGFSFFNEGELTIGINTNLK